MHSSFKQQLQSPRMHRLNFNLLLFSGFLLFLLPTLLFLVSLLSFLPFFSLLLLSLLVFIWLSFLPFVGERSAPAGRPPSRHPLSFSELVVTYLRWVPIRVPISKILQKYFRTSKSNKIKELPAMNNLLLFMLVVGLIGTYAEHLLVPGRPLSAFWSLLAALEPAMEVFLASSACLSASSASSSLKFFSSRHRSLRPVLSVSREAWS